MRWWFQNSIPYPGKRIGVDLPKIGDPLRTSCVIENVSPSPIVTNGLLMILVQEIQAIRAMLEATTGYGIRPAPKPDESPAPEPSERSER